MIQIGFDAAKVRTIFLDRDGVVNKKMPEGRYVRSWNEFHLLPGVPEAIAQLNRKGLRTIVVSNQRGVALGLYTVQDVISIHSMLQHKLNEFGARIDGFYFCPHDRHACNCRKPLPSLFIKAAEDFKDISADSSVMIGDSLSDMQFGCNLGMQTVYIENNSDSRKMDTPAAKSLASICCRSLPEAVEVLMGKTEE